MLVIILHEFILQRYDWCIIYMFNSLYKYGLSNGVIYNKEIKISRLAVSVTNTFLLTFP